MRPKIRGGNRHRNEFTTVREDPVSHSETHYIQFGDENMQDGKRSGKNRQEFSDLFPESTDCPLGTET